MLRRGGLFVFVGIPASSEGNLQIEPWEFVPRDSTLVSGIATANTKQTATVLAHVGHVTGVVHHDGSSVRNRFALVAS